MVTAKEAAAQRKDQMSQKGQPLSLWLLGKETVPSATVRKRHEWDI